MFLLKNLYYLFEPLFLLYLCLKKKNQFVILTPRFLSLLIKRVIIFNLKKSFFFSQYVRNYYDINTVFQIFGYEEYSLNSLKIWKKIEKELVKKKRYKKIIVDCGSNIGSSSRYFSEVYKDVFIYSIEPDYKNFLYLKKNITKKNVYFINNAVASSNYNYEVIKNKDPRAHNISIKLKHSLKKTITINQILKMSKNEKSWPFIIKIDIEGFEKDLFKNNIEWMNEFKIIIIELHDWMIPSQSISYNFINALTKTMKYHKRDLIIKGENIVSIKNN